MNDDFEELIRYLEDVPIPTIDVSKPWFDTATHTIKYFDPQSQTWKESV